MKVSYRKRFLKQLANLPPATQRQVEMFAFEQLPKPRRLTVHHLSTQQLIIVNLVLLRSINLELTVLQQ